MSVSSIIWAIVLLAANGFFVAAEFALIAARRPKLQALADEGARGAKAALKSAQELSLMLAGAQLGITMASLGLGFVAEPAVGHVVENALGALGLPEASRHTTAVIIALTIVVYLHMVIGEMAPKNVAIAEPEKASLILAGPMRAFVKVFRPFIGALNGFANWILSLFGIEARDEIVPAHTARELSRMVAESRSEGLVDEEEHRLLTGALAFGERNVSSVMVPRSKIVALLSDATAADLEAAVSQHGHSRFPVMGRDLDDVLGFVHAKSLLDVPRFAWTRPIPTRHVRRMLVVAEQQLLPEVLVEMRQAGVHVAVVQDQAGDTLGLVTLEDVLEALVGDIRDEFDRAPSGS